jgi:hypothetical protein
MINSKLYKTIIVGHLVINVPVVLLSFGLPIIAFNLFDGSVLKIVFSIIGFILGIVISWLLWSLLITKWRLWAFNQIHEDDWYKLKELAIINKLIWDDGSDFELTEIRTNEDNEQIIEIAERISEQEQIEEIKLDLSTPKELRFKFNKKEILVESISKLLLIVVSIGLFSTNQILLGFILLGTIMFYGKSYKLLNHAFNNKDYLLINEKGIVLLFPEEQIIDWEVIDKLAINIAERKMKIIKIENGKFERIDCELWRFKINDYRKFQRQVKVFVDRLIYKQKENGSQQRL